MQTQTFKYCLVVVSFFMFHVNAIAQNSVLERQLNIQLQNTSVKEAMEIIMNEASLVINYAIKDAPKNRIISKEYNNWPLEKIIRDIWKGVSIKLVPYGNSVDLIILSNTAIKGKVIGFVIDDQENPIPFASVFLKNTTYGGSSDENGNFSFTAPNGNYTITARVIGYKETGKVIDILPNGTVKVSLILTKKSEQLDEVVVTGQTETKDQKVIKSGYKVDIIKTDAFKNQPYSLTDVIKQTSGVHIRESGGLGSSFNIYLNGLSGNKIRFFWDGIPMENFGSPLTLNNFPVNLIKKIEIYKGVIPVQLGSDALGGSINISSVDLDASFLNASISLGSFNTQRASFNGQHNFKNGLFTSFSSYYNYSDNNYRMNNVNVYDLDFGNFEKTISTKRFHNLYQSYMGNIKVGIKDKKYADAIYMSLTTSVNTREYQHPETNIETVYGDFHSKAKTNLFSIYYKKKWEKLAIKGSVLKGRLTRSIIDTSSVRYNWVGETFPRSTDAPDGEIFERKRYMTIMDAMVLANIISSYHIDERKSIHFSINHNHLKRQGSDRKDEFNYIWRIPGYVNKTFAGISYEYKTLNDKIRTSVFAKKFLFNAKINIQEQQDGEIESTNRKTDKTGYGATFSYKATKNTLIKTSYEKAFRFPNNYEILGNGSFIVHNPDLKPEKSNNINLGVLYSSGLSNMYLKTEANIFLRFSEDFIQRGAVGGPYSMYDNINNVRSQGIEANVNLRINEHLSINTNATYQKIIERTKTINDLPNENYNNEIPNIPYLFANSRITITPFDILKKNSFTIYLDSRYVKEFFLSWKGLGAISTKSTIPTQFINDATLAYSFKNSRYTISLSCLNVFDTEAYDNFKIQKPGRSLFVKLIYNLLK